MLLRVANEQRGHPLEGEHLVLVDMHIEPGQRAGHHEARPVGVRRLDDPPVELQRDAELVQDVQRGDALEVGVPPIVLYLKYNY